MSDPALTDASLRVALLQTVLIWQDAAANRAHFSKLFSQLVEVDLVVLPETFSSGFSMQSSLIAETMQGDTVLWLQQQAALYQFAICGSMAIQTEQGICNRLLWVQPDGQIDYYDKRHLFRMGGEHQHYVAGKQRQIVHYRGFRFNLQICYDLRFPVFARNQGDYDVLIYVANWPAARRQVWQTLLTARAMENQAYVLGCNRVGIDGNGLEYSGDSVVLNYLGEPMAAASEGQPAVLLATLQLADLQQGRQKFPVALDADAFCLM